MSALGLTDSGAVQVTGTTTLTASTSTDIVLDNTGNNFGGSLSVSSVRDATFYDINTLNLTGAVARDLTVNSVGATTLGALTVGRDWVHTASGLADSGTATVVVTGKATLDARGQDITLNNAGNDVDGWFTVLDAANIDITDVDALSFSGNAMGTNKTLRLAATGALSLGVVSSTGNMTLRGAAMSLDTLSSGGDLDLVATGALTQSADKAVRVSGASAITATSVAMPTPSPVRSR